MAEKKGLKKKVMKGKGKFARIRSNLEREKSNLRKVLISSGIEQAKTWVDELQKKNKDKSLHTYLTRLINKRNESARPNRNAHKARRPVAQRRKG